MPTNKRITDLTDYTSVLPYASELFGVYQPMIGWKSKRTTDRYRKSLADNHRSLLNAFVNQFAGVSDVTFVEADCSAQISKIGLGELQHSRLSFDVDSVLLNAISQRLPTDGVPANGRWREFVNPEFLERLLNSNVAEFYRGYYHQECVRIH